MLSSVMLRQNPHNVHEWHKRIKLFGGDTSKQITAYTEAIQSVDCNKVRQQFVRRRLHSSLAALDYAHV